MRCRCSSPGGSVTGSGRRTCTWPGWWSSPSPPHGAGSAGDITMLIIARAVQGLGAALMTPQTMAVITRIFPPDRRGAAMGLWGAVAGVASLVGPILGGVLVDSLGWEWIFFINVPIGIVAFMLAVIRAGAADASAPVRHPRGRTQRHRPVLPRLRHPGRRDLQLGHHRRADLGVGPHHRRASWCSARSSSGRRSTRGEPLLPLKLFRDRNFSLANIGITTVGFAITACRLPLICYVQIVRGLTPTESALMLVPMAVITGALSPVRRQAHRLRQSALCRRAGHGAAWPADCTG